MSDTYFCFSGGGQRAFLTHWILLLKLLKYNKEDNYINFLKKYKNTCSVSGGSWFLYQIYIKKSLGLNIESIFSYLDLIANKSYIDGNGKINNNDLNAILLLISNSFTKNWTWSKFVKNQNNILSDKKENNFDIDGINWFICSSFLLSAINSDKYSEDVYQFYTNNDVYKI